MTNSTQVREGWQSSPNTRGTVDILWSCGTTVFVSFWVMMHLNVPSEREEFWKVHARKAKWLLLALAAPELVMLFAGGQWASAKRSVVDMRKEEFGDWSMVHAFYADSGGFVLQTDDAPDFPITAKQLHYLVLRRHLQLPSITRQEIWDKSKADFFAKTIACFQVGWFLLQIVARAIQKMPITLIELATLALLTCTTSTFFFWFCKPLDVTTPTKLRCESTLAQILETEGRAGDETWQHTPLDFIEPLAYSSSQMPGKRFWAVSEKPLPRIPNDRDSQLHDLRTVIIIAIPTAAFSLFHLIAWNFHFPTDIERQMWRWSCIGSGIVLGTGCTVEMISIIKSGYTETGLTTLRRYKLRWPHKLLFIIPAVMYTTGRLVVFGEVLASLRQAPAGCFLTPEWTNFLPHAG